MNNLNATTPKEMFRLFKNVPMYFDGRERTLLRGKPHLIASALIFPCVFYFYYQAAMNNQFVLFVGLLNVIIVWIAHTISGIYHGMEMTLENEIMMQKLDHVFLAWYITACYYPMSLLLFPSGPPIYLFLVMVHLVQCYIWYNIWNGSFSVKLHTLLVVVGIPLFYFYMLPYFTTLELRCFVLAILIGFIALLVQLNEYCPSCFNVEGVFNHFDFYHVFSVACFSLILLLNYSIVKRCGGESKSVNESL